MLTTTYEPALTQEREPAIYPRFLLLHALTPFVRTRFVHRVRCTTSRVLTAVTAVIAQVRRLAAPHEDTLGRPMKVSKECVAGLVAALEEFVSGYQAEAARAPPFHGL